LVRYHAYVLCLPCKILFMSVLVNDWEERSERDILIAVLWFWIRQIRNYCILGSVSVIEPQIRKKPFFLNGKL
jgi:hypothetical protein